MWIADQVKGTTPDIYWSIGLIPWGANLGDAAAGQYNSKYLDLAKQMASTYANEDQIYIRLGWEFNGDGWFPWSAKGQEENYVGAFRQFVDTFRSISDKFVFEWTPNAGDMGTDIVAAYPGDDYVDVVGIDFYYNTQWDSTDPVAAWNWFVNQPYGLQWQQEFAAAHGKQTTVGEWGVNSDTAGPFIELAAQWFSDHDMLYQNYWNSNAAFQGSLSDGQYPNAAAVYQAIFGGEGVNPYAADTTPVLRTGGAQVDLLIGHAGNDVLNGGAGDDWLHGNAGADALSGGAGSDVLDAGTGNDILDGGRGADILNGGAGDDTYYVDDAGDRVIELASEGNDQVLSSVSFQIGDQSIETVRLTGHGAIDATGNGLANTLVGTIGNNILDGRGGADIMRGDAGNDTYYVDDAGDQVFEYENLGYDQIFASVSYDLAGRWVEKMTLTGTAGISAFGNSLANVLIGNSGGNVIDGRGGADILNGGAGDDTYYVDDAGDRVIELAGEGNDQVLSSVSFQIGDQSIETVRLTGHGAIDATGNGLANTLVGTIGNNILDGRGGADIMRGDAGNDTYYVDDAGDQVFEYENLGYDQIFASVSYDLAGRWVEKMTLTGTAGISAFGNSLANVLIGNSGNNVIDGRGGNDTLTGNGGNDTFVLSESGRKTITDFSAGDKLDLSAFVTADAKPQMAMQGHDTVITIDNATSIVLLGVSADRLQLASHGLVQFG